MPDPQKQDLRQVGNIPRETLDYLAKKKTVSPVAALLSIGLLIVVVCLGFFFLDLIFGSDEEGTKASTAVSTVADSVPITSKESLANCDVVTAEQVLDSATKMMYVTESDSGATYTFRADWWDSIEDKAPQLMKGIANADACKYKEARMLIFLSPTKNEIGRADPITGFHF